MRETPRLHRRLAMLGVATLTLAACGGNDDPTATESSSISNDDETSDSSAEAAETTEATTETAATTAPSTAETTAAATDSTDTSGAGNSDAAAAVRDSVDATFAAESFALDAELELELGADRLVVGADGEVGYSAAPTGDVRLYVEANSGDQEVSVRTDGVNVWVQSDAVTGDEWVEGGAELLTPENFNSESLIGAILVLRGAQEVEVGDTEEVDGVNATEYTTTINYSDAVEAAGPDAEQLTTSFSLSGAAADSDLDIEVWIGDDGIIRDLEFDVVSDLVDGGYDLELTGVNQGIDVPEAPPADQTITGPEAEQLLAQIMG